MPRSADTDLVRRLRAGDESAFTELDRRHRRALVAYARRLVRSDHDAQDVVQDALLTAYRVLRDEDRAEVRALRSWLYALVRNRAIDEVRRARHRDTGLPPDQSDRGRGDPVVILARKETVRRLVQDIAELPDQQRAALLMREVDGASTSAVGHELGISADAAQMLVARARGSLVRTRRSRDADCVDVRSLLDVSHERGVRAPEHALRHARHCPACRTYRRDLRRVDRRLRALTPPLWLFPAALAAKFGVGSGQGRRRRGRRDRGRRGRPRRPRPGCRTRGREEPAATGGRRERDGRTRRRRADPSAEGRGRLREGADPRGAT